MKKYLLSIIIISLAFIFLFVQSHNNYKVFDASNPIEIYLDFNQNLIFDETLPFKIDNFHYIGEKNLNEDEFPFLKELSPSQKFLSEYLAKDYAKRILNNRFVKIKNNEIFVHNQKYSNLMLNSKYVFDNSENSQKLFIENIKNINPEEYVIFNNKNKKYHKIQCEHAKNIPNYRIIKLSKAKNTGSPCKYCFLDNKIVLDKLEIKNNFLFQNSIKDVFETKTIKIFFQDLNEIMKPTDKCSSKACKALKNEIENTKTSIDFAIYGINNQPEIFSALINAEKRGIKIRWICDFDTKYDNYYEDSSKLKNYLTNYKTDENYDKSNYPAIMHNKFFIFDDRKVWTGSSNITSTDLTGFNANYSILINSSEIAEKYKEEFEQMYNGYFHKNKKTSSPIFINIEPEIKVKPLFSPQNNIIYSEIIPLINNAEKYIYIPIFFLTHKEMGNALINAHKRGVEIKIINDATNAHTKYTIHKMLRQAGIKVKTENYAGKMHMKTMIIDDYITVSGSMNYTRSANDKNDENVLIIYNEDIAEFFKNTFIYLWNKIPVKYEKYDPKAESKESIGSCFDGIDNDFDGKIDSEDEGCF